MIRKKIVNKEKFQFREEEVLPPQPVNSKKSFQSRLVKKAGAIEISSRNDIRRAPPQIQCPTDSMKRNVVNHLGKDVVTMNRKDGNKYFQNVAGSSPLVQSTGNRTNDPVLDEIVAKLKSGLHLGSNFVSKANGEDVDENQSKRNPTHLRTLSHPSPRPPPVEEHVQCVCYRPLKLVMCEVCGETFRGRVSIECSVHPKALYLQDVKECKWCKQGNRQALKEFELPAGMDIIGKLRKLE